MAPTFRYSHPTTPAGTGFDTDLGSVVPWGSITGLVTMAKAGEVGQSSIYIDDPEGSLDIKGLHRFRMVESDADTDPVWNGYIGHQTIGRIGANERFLTGDARSWELALEDDNAILGFRVVWDTDGNRPAETGSARLAWLISTNYLGDAVDDGYVSYPATAYTMDATDYRGQFGKDVLADVALQCGGVNFFAQYNLSTSGTSQSIGLWFGDSDSSTAFTSSALIDNRPGSADGTAIFAPSDDTVLVRDPSRIAAGVYLPYDGGSIYAYDYTTSYDYAFRDQVAPTATISSQAQATALTDRFLADFNEPDERITTTIWPKPANLYDIRAGHRLFATFQHLPGYETGRWMRVTQKTIGNFNTSLGRYEVGLELSPQTTGQVIVLALASMGHDNGQDVVVTESTQDLFKIDYDFLAGYSIYSGGRDSDPYLGLGAFGDVAALNVDGEVNWVKQAGYMASSGCFHLLKITGARSVEDWAHKTTYGPGFYMPSVTVGSRGGLLVSMLTQVTSGATKVTPTGYTELHNDDEPLGDRSRCTIWTRWVPAGTYGGEGYGNSGEADNTQGVTTVVIGGADAAVDAWSTTDIIHPTAATVVDLAL